MTLKDAKEISKPGTPLKDILFIASTNIETWQSGPADAKLPNGDTFRTDTDISKGKVTRDRELQEWQPSDSPASPGAPTAHHEGVRDEVTFGPGATGNPSWDQFAANEQMFGVTTSFDEEVYTTKLDRSAADFKERERKAQRIASEIMASTTNNLHIAEERNLNVDDSGVNEEDKYGAVVRGSNAYIPPGARKQQQLQQQPGFAGTSAINSPPPKPDIPKVSVNTPDGTAVAPKEAPPTTKSTSPAPSTSSVNKPPADPLPAFRDFVTNERQRLTQKKQALVKSEMDKRKAELMKFSQTFKLNKPIPDDLVPILAKDEEKQRQIREKATQDAASTTARTIGAVGSLNPSPSASRVPQIPVSAKVAPDATRKPISVTASTKTPAPTTSASTSKVAPKPSEPGKANGKPIINMYIQPIPPFRGNKTKSPSPQTNGSSSNTTVPTSPTSTNRLNANASSFRPNPKASAFTPGPTSPIPSTTSASASASPHVKPAESTPVPNPFFGTKVVKKAAVHVKDEFNPFKHNKVAEANNTTAMWPYSGKRYGTMFPSLPHQPPQQPAHVAPPGPPPVTHHPYEEGEQRFIYVPYYHGQPMMPGMAPPPPGAFVSAPFMQPMPYPPAMPPNAQPMYAASPMPQMPPPQYMPPPPGTYPPPPNGAGPRPSMPPTPTPMHAHPYYHQSPQLQHAVPYPMMMPQGGPSAPPHAYEAGPAPPPMGGVGHA
jgi:PAB1-binding protein PBP1